MKKSLLTLFVASLTTQIAFANSADSAKNDKIKTANNTKTTELETMNKAENKLSERGQLLSAEFVASIKKDKINAYFPERKEMKGNIDNVPKYDIDLYKITYGSIYQGQLVELSGLVVVPKKDGKITQLQYHHGTLYPYPAKDGWGSLDAPSLYQGDSPKTHKASYETRLNGNYLGSYGYLVSLPDYVGYGISKNVQHPYGINPELAKQSVDMILATKAFAKQKNLPLNDGLFLTGWSEGGAVSVATQKLIESQYKDNIHVLADAPMSGMLNSADNFKQLLANAPQIEADLGEGMDFLAWTYYAYNQFSQKPIDFNKMFTFPVKNDLDILQKRPSDKPSKVFKILDKTSLDYLAKQADLNNLSSGWSPVAPLFIHHGTADTTVPFQNNAEVALKNYQDNGGNATLIKYEGHTHESLGLLYLNHMLAEFGKIQDK